MKSGLAFLFTSIIFATLINAHDINRPNVVRIQNTDSSQENTYETIYVVASTTVPSILTVAREEDLFLALQLEKREDNGTTTGINSGQSGFVGSTSSALVSSLDPTTSSPTVVTPTSTSSPTSFSSSSASSSSPSSTSEEPTTSNGRRTTTIFTTKTPSTTPGQESTSSAEPTTSAIVSEIDPTSSIQSSSEAASSSPTKTSTGSLATSTSSNESGGGLSKKNKNIVIGCVVGIGGAIIIAALGFVAFKVWGKKNMHSPVIGPEDKHSVEDENDLFRANIDQYHNQSTNAAANF